MSKRSTAQATTASTTCVSCKRLRILERPLRCRIFIIDEVHMLTNQAFNALLKLLEEPPPAVHFIFATTEPHKVLDTIKSRCQRHDFKRIPTRRIMEQLEHVCGREQHVG